MIALALRVGVPVAALIGVAFWLLPASAAARLLAALASLPLIVWGLARMPDRMKIAVQPFFGVRYAAPAVFAVGLSLPLWAGNFEQRFFSEMLILGLLAMSLDVMMGFVGLASFAHAALAGAAAYAAAIMLTRFGWSPWAAIAFALAAGTALTTCMGAFSVRARDIYFGIITLVFGSVAFIVANSWVSVTNGEDGMTIEPPALDFFGLFAVDSGSFAHFWYLTFGVVFLSYLCLRVFLRAPVGLVFRGIRENERRAAYLGYSVNAYKIFNTAVSGFFTSMAGALLLLKNGIIGTEQMDVIHSGEVVIWSVVGGLGTLVGPFIGASFVHVLNDFLGEHTERAILIIGLFFIITILLAPRGIVGSIIQVWRIRKSIGEGR